MHTAVINKKRPLIYAIIITIGFIFLQNILHTAPDQYFFLGMLMLYPILLFELLITRYYAKLLLNQFALPPVNEDQDRFAHIIHPLVYFSLVCFLYFHKQLSIQPFLFVIILLIFWLLFTNIRAYYEDKFKLELLTHNIYDIITILAVFFILDSFSNIIGSNNFNVNLVFFPQTFSFLLFFKLICIRYKITGKFLILILLSVILGAVAVILTNIGLSELAISFLLSETFYFIFAYMLHMHDGSASLKILSEYFIIFIMSLVLLISLK